MADFAAQAVINAVLSHAYPNDPVVGEEDTANLRAATPESDVLRARAVELAAEEEISALLGKRPTTQRHASLESGTNQLIW